jgi:hypothetical protein
MSKLASVTERIRETKQMLDEEGDKLMVRLDQVQAAAPATLARAHTVIDQQVADVGALEAELRQLSNAPLE